MKLKIDIKSNAIDSFNEALAKFNNAQQGDTRGYKFAILHLSHAIELILKMYLQTLNENLIFIKTYNAVRVKARHEEIDLLAAFHKLEGEGYDFEIPIKGINNPFTVLVSDVLALARHEKCSKTGNNFIDEDFIDDIKWMKEIRNAIEHFEFEFTPKEVRLCIGRLIQSLNEFSDIFSLFNLKEHVSKENIEIFEVLVDEYQRTLAELHTDIREAKEAVFSQTRPKYHMFIEWNEYHCDDCGNTTMIPDEQSSTGYKCKSCGNEESGQIEVDCDVCGLPLANEDMSYWGEELENVCPRCQNPEAY